MAKTLTEIEGKIIIDKKFVDIISSEYTPEALEYILQLVKNAGSIAFISDKHQIYANGKMYSGTDYTGQLNFFDKISDGTNAYQIEGMGGTLTFAGEGSTTVKVESGKVIISSGNEVVNAKIDELNSYVSDIKNSYLASSVAAETYQVKLTPGGNVKIEDNVISTYGFVLSDYFDEFKESLSNQYASKEDVNSEISYQISKIVDDAPEAFDTLKEIADWISSSITYNKVDNITAENFNEKLPLYIKDENANYVAAESYDPDADYYSESAITAGNIISDINDVKNEIGTKKDGDTPATGIYDYIDTSYNSLNNEIKFLGEKLEALKNNSLTTSYNSSYAVLSTNTEADITNVDLTITEAIFENGQITNGLTTASTVADMINYANGWIILAGE